MNDSHTSLWSDGRENQFISSHKLAASYTLKILPPEKRGDVNATAIIQQ